MKMMNSHPRRQSGFSMIELMVAVTISMILLGGMIAVVVNSNRSFNEMSKSSEMLENGGFAMRILQEELSLAGYYGEYFELEGTPSGIPDPCSTTATDIGNSLLIPVQGYDEHTGALSTCIADANHKDGTDILVVRRAETTTMDLDTSTTTTSDDPVAGELYIQSTSSERLILNEDDGSVATDGDSLFTLTKRDGATTEDLRRMKVSIYYISPCSTISSGTTCSSSDDGIPTLKRIALDSSGGFGNAEPLIEGVEDMQFEYGLDTDDDGMPDSYTAAPTTADDWSNVVTVKIHMLVRNIDETQGYTDSKTYTLGKDASDADYTVSGLNDKYKRHVFSAAVRVINVAMRREDS